MLNGPAAALDRAYGYPYPAPDGSWLYRDGGASAWPADGDPAGHGGLPRTPVLSYGSNRAPVQLARKYAGWPAGTEIPVTRGWLAAFDVVHAARLAAYGSVPATLARSPGTVVEVGVLWLTGAQLVRMHETEGVGRDGYAYLELAEIGLELDGGPRLERVATYEALSGPLLPDGTPRALAAVPARGRRFPELDQRGALTLVRDRLAPGHDLDAFVLAAVSDPDLNRAHRAALRAFGRPLGPGGP